MYKLGHKKLLYFILCPVYNFDYNVMWGDNMGKTSSAVKDRYNAKVYDEIKIRVNKGQKASIQIHAESRGESVNGFINRAISEAMERDKDLHNA